jgi:hypothetical protein
MRAAPRSRAIRSASCTSCRPTPARHPIGLDEQAIELARLSGALQQDGEADDHAVLRGDPHMPRPDLLLGQLDRVGIRRQLRPVQRVMHRGAALQPFECLAF